MAVPPPGTVEVMFEPGANKSRHDPKFEKLERASADVVEPTVIAAAARAGDVVHASVLLLPAATTTATPLATSVATAESSDELTPPPRLMFATARCSTGRFFAIQSSPAITPEYVPEPSQPRTRTGTSAAAFAIP
jgi:hypothetical protein